MSEKSGKRKERRREEPMRPSSRRPPIPPGFPMKPRLSRRAKERKRELGDLEDDDETPAPE